MQFERGQGFKSTIFGLVSLLEGNFDFSPPLGNFVTLHSFADIPITLVSKKFLNSLVYASMSNIRKITKVLTKRAQAVFDAP